MILNRLEFALMNNPVRAALQRHAEARMLLSLGGTAPGSTALEVGCGRGVGVEVILDRFEAARVDAFDIDPRMIECAKKRLKGRNGSARLWQGVATEIPVGDNTYDSVFVFGVLHHVQAWRKAVGEIARVLKPGGRFYAEEALRPLITARISRLFFEHPQIDRFDERGFIDEIERVGFQLVSTRRMANLFAWFIADLTSEAAAPYPPPRTP